MLINADFSKRVVVHCDHAPWTPSPMAGVERKMLDRIGGEVARATSLVRFAPGSEFARHTHEGGEEVFVLEGLFQDDFGDYPAGVYLRNPPGSSHAPRSGPGCVLFVKLHQFDSGDTNYVRRDVRGFESSEEGGAQVILLHRDARETVAIETWGPGACRALDLPGGWEALVLQGEIEEGGDTLRQHAWIRVPAGGKVRAAAGPRGAKLWVKTGHLAHVIGGPSAHGET